MKWIPLIPLLLLLTAMELIVRKGWVPHYLLPSPSEILKAFFEDGNELWKSAGETLFSAVVGFIGSAVLGIFLGVLFSSARWIERAFYPYAIFFQTMPIIAIAP